MDQRDGGSLNGYDVGLCLKCHEPVAATEQRVVRDPEGHLGSVHDACYFEAMAS